MREIHFQNKGHELTRNLPCLCCVSLDFLMLFILFGVKKSPLVLFDTPAIFVWGEGWLILASRPFPAHTYSLQEAPQQQQQKYTMLLL